MSGAPWQTVIASSRASLAVRARPAANANADADVEDLWLWEYSQRVMRTAQMLCAHPEVRESCATPPDPDVCMLAGLFAAAGWAVQVEAGEIGRWEVLRRSTTDNLREMGVTVLESVAGEFLPERVVTNAARVIRECNDRHTRLAEAQVVAEAENLNDIGLLHALRQFRQFQAEGRSLAQFLLHWQRRVDYGFWRAHIDEALRWDVSRRIAEDRLKTVGMFMDSLSKLLAEEDLTLCLREAGADLSTLLPRT